MAPKGKSRLVEEPPSASSSEEQEQVEESQEEQESEEEQEQSEEEQESEEEEEEEPKTAPPVQKIATNSKTPQTKPQSSSSSESGSGSDSDSDSGQSQQPSPSASDFTVKPSAPVVQPSKVPSKRPQEKAQKDSTTSRKKPKIVEEKEEHKKASSSSLLTPNRLWNDEDQIAVLKGMAEFKALKGIEPNSDMSAFHDFVKGKLQVEVSKSQLSDKVRRLKKKFLTHVKNSGGDPVFPKAHDYLVFEYSKKIWGSDNNNDAATSNGVNENVVDTNGKAKKNAAAVELKKGSESKKSAKVSTKSKDVEKPKDVAVKEVVKEDIVKVGDRKDFQSKYPHLAASFDLPTIYPSASDMLKKNMSLIDGDKAKVLEEKWKKLHDAEADLMLKRLDLVREHYKLVVDAMRGN